eukprot:CAMPEP_0172299120 /NCGR_PEP_ID=MMETSP1058-20130122/1498_1 /TAXON_ID=83371 /ORGANISM="Detonula confervacea, Strain CCMP 353" /LENGTH=70 /DNA_ID=CAMNT_0013008451 /DNA_START=21 /DNA_END=230 /DNA_ORIENTATION=-
MDSSIWRRAKSATDEIRRLLLLLLLLLRVMATLARSAMAWYAIPIAVGQQRRRHCSTSKMVDSMSMISRA